MHGNLSLTSADGMRLHGHRWEARPPTKADVALVHGAFEHLGRHEHVALRLADAGYRVTGADFRGHGRSDGRRGHVRRWRDYLDDLSAVEASVAGPYFLVCHSMGGLVGLQHARQSAAVRGVVASAPLLGLLEPLPTGRLLAAKILSCCLPSIRFKNRIEPASLCSDDRVVEAYRNDPLVFHRVSARWSTEMLTAMERLQSSEGGRAPPLLCVYGRDDRIVDTEAIESFAARWGGEHEVRSWPGMRHETLLEPGRDAVVDHVVQWLDRRVSGGDAVHA